MKRDFLKKIFLNKSIRISSFILAIVLGAMVIFLIIAPFISKENKNKDLQNIVEPESSAQLQVSSTDPAITSLIEKIYKHIFLPGGQVKILTVVKPDELKKLNPIFYQFVKEGDKLLIYSDRAILYDPVADKILDLVHVVNQ